MGYSNQTVNLQLNSSVIAWEDTYRVRLTSREESLSNWII